MISVGRRVQEAIDHMGKGEITLALTPACIALDITAQRHSNAKRSGRTHFKKFIQDYLWVITYIGFPGLMTPTLRIPFSHPEVKADAAGNVGIEDIIYHIIRCSLIHSDQPTAKIIWNKAVGLGKDPNGNLVLSENLVWGILGAIIFSPHNKAEKIPDTYWFRIADFQMFISELWGRIDLAKRVVKLHTGIDYP